MVRKNSKHYRLIRRVAMQYKVTLRLTSKINCTNPIKSTIYMNKNHKNIDTLLMVFFHELGHIVAYRDKKYVNYHEISKKRSYKKRRACLYSGLKAERYADKMGRMLMKRHFPKFKYGKSYSAKATARWYHDNFLIPNYGLYSKTRRNHVRHR